MSTEPGPTANPLERLLAKTPPTKVDDTAATLEARLQHAIDARREERFAWIFAVCLLVDVITFPHLSWGMIPVFLLEIVFLIFMAEWLGVDGVAVFLVRIFNRYCSSEKTEATAKPEE